MAMQPIIAAAAGTVVRITAPATATPPHEGVWKRYLTFRECSRASQEQPPGDQHGQCYGGELCHIAGVTAVQYGIGHAAAVLTGIEDLVQDPDRQHAIGRDAQKDTDHEPHGDAQDQ